MLPYANVATRPFLPGPPGAAFVSYQLLPLHLIRGAGTAVKGQLAIEFAPLVQTPAVPQAWHGLITGQFVSQPLTAASNNGSGIGG